MSEAAQDHRHGCLSCGSKDLHENRSYQALPRVTSDSVPFSAGGRLAGCLACGLIQKIVDAQWLKDIGAIYNAYQMYALTEGADQVLFEQGAVTRAEKMVDILSGWDAEPFTGKVLDIGCGTGGFLKAFGNAFPKASLFGQEIDDKNLSYLQNIPNFKGLFTRERAPQGQVFDLIVSIHCFEHIFDYPRYFEGIAALRHEATRILLEVPDIETSPFDIAIADHAAHFSKATLQRCLDRHAIGFAVEAKIHKELTALAPQQPKTSPVPAVSKDACIQELDERIDYLQRLLELVDNQKLNEFGVYGTTIAGAWLTAAQGDKIAFYIDDDPRKHGKAFCNKGILAAQSAPAHCKVVLPFALPVVRKILQQHPELVERAI